MYRKLVMSSTEQTEWVEPKIFLGSIAPFAGNKKKEVLEAKMYTDGVGEMYL